MNKYLKTAKEFFRLLGAATNTPSNSTDIELARFVVDNAEFFVNRFERATMSGGDGLKLSGYIGKYLPNLFKE